MTAPLSAAEDALRDQAAERRVEAELAARVAWAKAEQLAKKAETAQAEPQTALADATAAAKEAAGIVVPELPRLMTDDVTPESCVSLLATHGGRIAVLSAEGDVFATLTGTRYSAAPNLGVFLKGHAGDKLQVDRKGRPSETVDRPALTLGVTTQPGTLAGLAAQPGFRDRGVLARILYSLPVNTVGQRDNQAPPVPEDTETAYTDVLTNLVLLLADHETPHELVLTDEARQVLLSSRTGSSRGCIRAPGSSRRSPTGPPSSPARSYGSPDCSMSPTPSPPATPPPLLPTPSAPPNRSAATTSTTPSRSTTSWAAPTPTWTTPAPSSNGSANTATTPSAAATPSEDSKADSPPPKTSHPPSKCSPTTAISDSSTPQARAKEAAPQPPTKSTPPPTTPDEPHPVLSVLSVLSGHFRFPQGDICVSTATRPKQLHLTIADVCAELGIARSTFYDWRAAKKAPRCFKLPNGDLRIRRTDFDNWLLSLEDAA
jgi:predicted DNA-binding transcriptional regulator AlpA